MQYGVEGEARVRYVPHYLVDEIELIKVGGGGGGTTVTLLSSDRLIIGLKEVDDIVAIFLLRGIMEGGRGLELVRGPTSPWE